MSYFKIDDNAVVTSGSLTPLLRCCRSRSSVGLVPLLAESGTAASSECNLGISQAAWASLYLAMNSELGSEKIVGANM